MYPQQYPPFFTPQQDMNDLMAQQMNAFKLGMQQMQDQQKLLLSQYMKELDELKQAKSNIKVNLMEAKAERMQYEHQMFRDKVDEIKKVAAPDSNAKVMQRLDDLKERIQMKKIPERVSPMRKKDLK